ncbi:putative cytochrome p450 protein [Neofusicoccum parvum UCRNP2]|uniref:Putative cytochrome p450 protein n=1 Tax=Botryosphaeria parva (strain UCR-NP2) TaxID=1287680 RepID=R1G724_BOTPV|nr:putative cytochrome p450 protein [Neofusicoccum parvum UCRNP2]
MAFSSPALTMLLLTASLLLFLAASRLRSARKYKLPPQVPGWPIVGNSLDVPLPAGMWAAKAAQKYGEMFTCRLGGKTQVFLNSSRVVADLLEKRSAKYSSRPWCPMAQDIMSGGCRMLLMPHCARWRAQRKIMHAILNGRSAEANFVPYQNLEARQLLHDYLEAPAQFYRANQRFANSVILSVVFGRRARLDDPELQELFESVEGLLEILFDPFKGICDSLPWLARLPECLQWWRPAGEQYFQKTVGTYRREFNRFLEKMDAGTARPCFAVDLMQGALQKDFDMDETERLFVFATLLEAGSDTSRTVLTQIIAAAAVYPEWTRKARALLDEVCGPNADRLPSLADRPRLPYIMAVVKEGLRWRPFSQIGQPHMLEQDDEYEGYRFPAGTLFTWNAYAIALNDNEYPDAMRFLPERFMNADLDSPLKGHWTFGAGRRVCVGYNVGTNNLWIAAASLLYCFDFEQDPDHPIDTLNTNWEAHREAPFAAKIKVRSQAHAALIRREAAQALAAPYD